MAQCLAMSAAGRGTIKCILSKNYYDNARRSSRKWYMFIIAEITVTKIIISE